MVTATRIRIPVRIRPVYGLENCIHPIFGNYTVTPSTIHTRSTCPLLTVGLNSPPLCSPQLWFTPVITRYIDSCHSQLHPMKTYKVLAFRHRAHFHFSLLPPSSPPLFHSLHPPRNRDTYVSAFFSFHYPFGFFFGYRLPIGLFNNQFVHLQY